MNKELETLKHLIYTDSTQEHSVALDKIDIDKCFDTIEKELKVLELIIKKNVDIRGLSISSLEFYNEVIIRVEKYHLTQDEYDFIKERVMRGERENE